MTRRIVKISKKIPREFDEEVKIYPSQHTKGMKRETNLEIAKISKRVREDNWDHMTSRELVALYAWCHNEVYGTMPSEMTPRIWIEARKASKEMIKEDFDHSIPDAIEFFRWVWKREANRFEWKVNKGLDISRINWKNMFVHKYLLTDYRIAKAVHNKKKNG